MGLPKLNTVEYFETLPVSQLEVKFRPFNVKEQKILLQTLEDGTPKAISNGMMMLIRSCSEIQDNTWTVDKLSNTDLEWLFLKIRMKSVGETTKIVLPCVKQDEGCDGQSPIEVDFDKMEIEGELKEPKVMLTDTIGVMMRIPSYSDVQELYEAGEEVSTDNIFKVLNKCIVQIFDADSVYDTKEFTVKEVDEFVDGLTVDQFNVMMDWFSSVPKMVYNVEFACSKCETVQEQKISGLQNFFV
tara:strand:+ start:1338 stop:2066 length:729 start_codon:yes stop_codon:yes gene_type:complete